MKSISVLVVISAIFFVAYARPQDSSTEQENGEENNACELYNAQCKNGTNQVAGGAGAPVPNAPIEMPEMNAQCQMLSQACSQQNGMAPPAAPAAPEMPEAPAAPAVPEAPAAPAFPEAPAAPSMPEAPEAPSVPEAPAAPSVPEAPEAPAVPEAPAAPSVPEAPAAPAIPEIPEIPAPGGGDQRYYF